MVSGKSWGITDVDDRTRELAAAAARRAGLTPEEWLRRLVAAEAGDETAASEVGTAAHDLDDEDAGGIAASLSRLGEQVRAMTDAMRTGSDGAAVAGEPRRSRDTRDIDETARSTVEGLGGVGPGSRGNAGLEDAIRGLEAQIAAVVARTATAPRRDPVRDTAYDDIRDRMDALLARGPAPAAARPSAADLERTLRELETRLANASRKPAPPPTGSEEARIRRIKARLAEISDRLAAPPPPPPAPPPPPPPPEPDVLSQAIADIARRQSALAGRAAPPAPPAVPPASPRDPASPAAIAALRTEVVVLSDRIAALAERSREDRHGVDGLADRIDRMAAVGQASTAALAATLTGLRDALDGVAAERAAIDPAAVAGLAAGLVELRHKVEGLEAAGRADAEVLRRIEHRLEDVVRADPAPLIRTVEDRIDGLAARIDAVLGTRSDTAALDAIRAEIGSVRAELATRDTRGLEGLENRIGELAEQVAAATRPDSGTDQLAALEARVEALAADLVQSTPRAAVLEQVEENLLKLQASLVEGRQESIEAARSAARNAVRELGATGADRDLVETLRSDLDEIRTLIGAVEQPGGADEAAVKETLASVAERIGSVAAGVEAPRPVVPSAYAPAHATVVPLPEAPRTEARSRQDLAAIRELAGSVSPSKVSGRRADFIAAARRAAQAAIAEANAGTGTGVGDRGAAEGNSPFARIGQAIRARRKPLLLAAAAIVLALGALQLVSRPIEVAGAASPVPPTRAVVVQQPTVGPARRAPAAPPPFAMDQEAGPRLVAPATDPRSGMDLAALDTTVTASTAPAAPGAEAVGPDALRRAAAEGDAVAAYEIATRYAEGRGVPRDLAQAAVWYQRAADAGLAPAKYRLGSLYERGQGVPRDMALAVSLYRQAAELGNVGAMHNFAVLTSEGAAGAPDPKAAVPWFLAAADYGVKDSQYNLGVVYARGLGAAANLPEAYKWFAVAAASGDKDAAARRDEVAAMLDQNQLALARAAAKAWRPKIAPIAANTVAVPANGWEAPAVVTVENQKALVMKIQTLLAQQGYDPGPADGVEGPKTRDAVRAFQARAGLLSTGTIDGTLVAALSGPAG